MIEFIANTEDPKNIHPMDEVLSTPGCNVDNSQLDTGLDTVADLLGKNKEPDSQLDIGLDTVADDTVKKSNLLALGEESSGDIDMEKDHSIEKSPSLMQAFTMLKRGRERKMKGCVHFYN